MEDNKQQAIAEQTLEEKSRSTTASRQLQSKETFVQEQSVESAVAADCGDNTKSVSATKKQKIKFFTAGNMAVMGILTAISFLLYAFVKFPLPFIFPGFLDIQISDLPALLGGFALGPIAGCIIIVVKCCLKMAMTSTACVGELADIIVGIAFVLPASLVYKFMKNRRGALLGLFAGVFTAVGTSVLANWLILIPFYAKAFGMDAIVGMMSSLYPKITADTVYKYYLPLAVIPFNVLRCVICAYFTYYIYKPLSRTLHWETGAGKGKVASQSTTLRYCPRDKVLSMTAKIMMLVVLVGCFVAGTVVLYLKNIYGCIVIAPAFVGLPLTIKVWESAKKQGKVHLAVKILTLVLFCLPAGVLLLCMKDDSAQNVELSAQNVVDDDSTQQ